MKLKNEINGIDLSKTQYGLHKKWETAFIILALISLAVFIAGLCINASATSKAGRLMAISGYWFVFAPVAIVFSVLSRCARNVARQIYIERKNANAKAAENREKFWLFTAMAELATLQDVTWLTNKPVVVTFFGGAVKYLPSVPLAPGQNTGKTSILVDGQEEIEINRGNIEFVPPHVIGAVVCALDSAKKDKAVANESAKQVLKSLQH